MGTVHAHGDTSILLFMRSTSYARHSLQEDLGEEEEWSIARAHAITRNRRYRTSNSSENEFNVDALLKTTTGLTMDDLRQKMANLKTARRQRALGASLDAVLAQFPSEDKVCVWVESCSDRPCLNNDIEGQITSSKDREKVQSRF